jgi:hypothetical protein
MSLSRVWSMRLQRRQAGVWRGVLARVTPHRIALGIVLLACAFGQTTILVQRPVYRLWPDSPEYLAAAAHIQAALRFTDPWRTPGYPTFLALIFALTGGEHLRAVVLTQAGVTIMTTVGLYVLAYRLTARRRSATCFAAIMGLNPLVLDWERTILTETLAYALIVALVLVFERYLRSERTATLVWFALLSVVAVLTRPQFIYLAATLLLLLAVRSLRRGDLRRRWRTLALACALAYLPLLGYMGANAATNGYFGLSDIANLNLFGKVVEYRMYAMPDAGAGPQFRQFQADVHSYMTSRQGEMVVKQVWDFVHSHPQYDAHHWSLYGAYSTNLIMHHPLYYLAETSPDVLAAELAPPQAFAPFSYVPPWLAALIVFFICANWIYCFFPILLVAAAVRAWRHPEDVASVMRLALTLAIAGNILIAAVTDFTEFGRLRFPLDGAMTLIFIIAAIEYVPRVARALASVRARVRAQPRPA